MEILPKDGVTWVDAGNIDAMASALTAAYQSRRRKPIAYDLSGFAIDGQVAKIHAFYRQVLAGQQPAMAN